MNPDPTALIYNQNSFLAPLLVQRLLSHGLKVVFASSAKDFSSSLPDHPDLTFLALSKSDPEFPNPQTSEPLQPHYVFQIESNLSNLEDINNTLQSTHITQELLKISQKSNAKYLFASISNHQQASDFPRKLNQDIKGYPSLALVAKAHQKNTPNLKAVLLLDVYGPHMDLKQNRLGQLFSAAKQNQPLPTSPNQDQTLFPVYVSDAVEALMKAMFTPDNSGNINIIAGRESITELNLSYTLRKLMPTQHQLLTEILRRVVHLKPVVH